MVLKLQAAGQTKDTCWKIHGKPVDWKPARDRERSGISAAVNDNTTSSESIPFSKELLKVLQQMFSKSSLISATLVIGIGTVAHKDLGFREDD